MAAKKKVTKKKVVAKKAPAKKTITKTKPKLLSGGNPQIAKGEGNAPVQAYIKAIPGWRSGACKRLDQLIERTVPDVKKAVKWNSPFYGVEGRGYFMGVHCFTKYIKVSFFFGVKLTPELPVGSKDPNARYFHIYEDDKPSDAQIADWVRQASAIPGWLT